MSFTKTFDCAEPWFSLIRDGIKTVEGRINNTKYNKLKKGDTIKLEKYEDSNEYVVLSVESIQAYKTFEEMIKSESLEKILPGIKDINEGVEVYRQFYKPEVELEKGVLAIRITVIN